MHAGSLLAYMAVCLTCRFGLNSTSPRGCVIEPAARCALFLVQNFKGSTGGTIFRCYPGDYQIYSRTRFGFSLVETRKEMPDLKQVALEVLPRAAAAAAAAAR